MLEVEISNFQSIEKAHICIDGFTAIAGRSNLGKSALLRALKAALTGAPVSNDVRHGVSCQRRVKSSKTCRCFCSVRIKSSGFDLLFEKGDFVNTYTINGKVYDKPERGSLEELLQYSPIQVGDDKVLLQIVDQFRPIFLLDQPGTVVAEVLGDVANLDRVNVAIGLAEKDRREFVSLRKVREGDVLTLQEDLHQYDGLDLSVENVGAVEKLLGIVEASQERVDQARVFLESAVSLSHRIRSLETAVQTPIPVSKSLSNGWASLESVSTLHESFVSRVSAVGELSGVSTLPELESQGITSLSGSLTQKSEWLRSLLDLKSWSEEWKAAEGVVVPDPLVLQSARTTGDLLLGFSSRLTILDSQVVSLEECATVAQSTDFSEQVSKLSEVYNQVARLGSYLDKHSSLLDANEELEKEMDHVQHESDQIRVDIRELGVCPTCARKLEDDDLCRVLG